MNQRAKLQKRILPEADLVYDTPLMRFSSRLFTHSLPRQTRAMLLLVLGLLAVTMLSLGGSRPAHADSGFYGEICTSKGLQAKSSAVSTGQNQPQPATDHNDCCKLCGTVSPLLLTDDTLAVSPAPTFSLDFARTKLTPPAIAARLSYPPRGPPLL